MKRVTLLLPVLLSLATATLGQVPAGSASGDLSVLTLQFNNQLLGVPHLAEATVWFTEMVITTTDPAATGFRVDIRYKDAAGEHAMTSRADLPPYGGPAVAFFSGVLPSQITSVSIAKRYDGPAQVIQ